MSSRHRHKNKTWQRFYVAAYKVASKDAMKQETTRDIANRAMEMTDDMYVSMLEADKIAPLPDDRTLS